LLAAATGCTALTSFDRNAAVEATADLCGDGVDNDDDGLTDCQDWKCVSQPACCDLPTVVLDDKLTAAGCTCPTEPDLSCEKLAPASCAPSPDTWTIWGSPLPRLCESGFVSCKEENCYDVGLLSKQAVKLEPGVKLRVTFSGAPELRGRLTAGLTFQQDPPAMSDEDCLPVTPLNTVASVELVQGEPVDGGQQSEFLLRFGSTVIGRLAAAMGAVDHEVTMAVEDGGRITFDVEGTRVKSDADQVIPNAGQEVRVALHGRGFTAHVSRVRLSHGARCEAHDAWTATSPAPVLSPAAAATAEFAWQDLAVFRPAIAVGPSGSNQPILAYSGCPNAGFSTCPPNRGGAAIADSKDGVFGLSCAFVSTSDGTCVGNGVFTLHTPLFDNTGPNNYDVGLGFTIDPMATGKASDLPASTLIALVSQPVLQAGSGGQQIRAVVRTNSAEEPRDWDWGFYPAGNATLRNGTPGTWNEEICCASFSLQDNRTQHVWYSGRDGAGIWRIGHATLGLDGTFGNIADPPVLEPGPSGSPDQRGVSDPEVVWDARRHLYRMWYVAHDSLDETSIGLAVSTDGLAWHRYPGNPVVRADQVGLRSVANPAVLLGDDGMRMWVDGESASSPGVAIFELRNTGAQPAP